MREKIKIPLTEIERLSLAALDESPEVLDDAVEYGSESYDLRRLIRDVAPAAGEMVLSGTEAAAASEWLPLEGSLHGVGNDGTRRRVFPLPGDYYRFLYLRMSDWTECETQLMRLDSELPGLRRYWEGRKHGPRLGSPGVSLTYHNGGRALEIFGSVEGSRVAEGGYLPRPAEDGDGNLIFPPSLRRALVENIVEMIKNIRR